MLHGNQESAASDGSSAGSKRNPFDIFTSIFRKKSKESGGEAGDDESDTSDTESQVVRESGSFVGYPNRTGRGGREPLESSGGCFRDGVLPNDPLQRSPLSCKVRSIYEDMEALRLSRQDNPYIQQRLERFSLQGDIVGPSASSSRLPSPGRQDQQRLIENDGQDTAVENDNNLHEHLIRSPPPQFPQHFSHFVFPSRTNSPQPGSKDPGGSASFHDGNLNNLPSPVTKDITTLLRPKGTVPLFPVPDLTQKRDGKKLKDLNPLLTKSGVDALDPRMREVLEFQRQNFFTDQRKDVTSPPDTSPQGVVDVAQRSLSLATKAQGRWSMTTASRSISLPTVQPGLSGISGSLLSLNGNPGDQENVRGVSLAPVKGGRSTVGIENLAFKC